MPSLTFTYRPSSRGSDYCGSLCLRMIHHRRVKILTSPYKLYAHEWDNRNQAIIFSTADRDVYLEEIVEYMNNSLDLAKQTITELEAQGTYTVEDFYRTHLQKINKANLWSYVNKLVHDLMLNKQERTARAYKTVSKGLIAFNDDIDLPLGHINALLIKDYEREMKESGKSLNTISFYMRNLRAIYNKAILDGYMEPKRESPFLNVFTGFNRTRKRALTTHEIGKLQNLEFTLFLEKGILPEKEEQRELYQSWRIFFFCFHTRGMSFVDMAYLRKNNIKGKVLSYYRKKTGQLMEIKITPTLKLLINSFKKSVENSEYVFPIIRDAEKPHRLQYESALRIQNKRLKKLASMVGIKQILSTHVTRHTWATIAKKENLPLWVISEGLGHCNEKTTYTYLASFDRSMLDHANDIIGAAITRNVEQQIFINQQG